MLSRRHLETLSKYTDTWKPCQLDLTLRDPFITHALDNPVNIQTFGNPANRSRRSEALETLVQVG